VLSYWCVLENARSPGATPAWSPRCIAPLDRDRVRDDRIRIDDRPGERGRAADVDGALAEGQPGDRGRLLKDHEHGEVDPLRPPTSKVGRGREGPMGDGSGDAAGLEASVTVALNVAVVAPRKR